MSQPKPPALKPSPTNPNFVALLFDHYLARVYPGQTLPPVQHQELKKCFFASFFAALQEMPQLAASLPEDVAVKALSAMQQECQTFAQDVINQFYRNN